MKQANNNAQRDQTLREIAKRELFLQTLTTRNSDNLDFESQAVWSVKAALEAAYEAGRQAASKEGK